MVDFKDESRQPAVTLVSEQYAPDMSSTAQLFEELMIELGANGIETSVCALTPGYVSEVAAAPLNELRKGVQVRRLPRLPFDRRNRKGEALNWLWGTCCLLVLALRTSRQTPLLICTNPPMAHVVGAVLKRWRGQRFIALFYDLHPELSCAVGLLKEGGIIDRWWRRLNAWSLRHADVAIAIGDHMEQAVKARFREAKTRVVHNWCDPAVVSHMPKSESDFAREHDLLDKFVVLFSGNMGWRQRLEILIEAAADLRDTPVRFVFIGEGIKKNKLQEMAQERGLSNVLFFPYQPRETIKHSMAAADLTVVSQEREVVGFGVPSKIYSCLASGRPILGLASRPCELIDIVEQAECGWVYHEDQDREAIVGKIRELIETPQHCERAGMNGLNFFREHYSLQVIARQYAAIIREQHAAGPEKALFSRLLERFRIKTEDKNGAEQEILHPVRASRRSMR